MIRLRPSKGSMVLAGAAVAFFAASRTAGAGWLTVMVAVAVSLLGWTAIDAWWAARHVTIGANGPADATVGREFELDLAARSPSPVSMHAIDPSSDRHWMVGYMEGPIAVLPLRRCVLRSVEVEVHAGGSLGVFTAIRKMVLTLPRPIDVAPSLIAVALPPAATSAGHGETAVGGRHSDGETVRSVREYQTGDPVRMINWAVTARRDQLAVKELEAPQAPTLVVVLDLSGDPGQAERNAAMAAGYVQTGLRSGMPVILSTHDEGGQHAGGVGSMLEAGRRLARATPGRPPTPVVDGMVAQVRLGPG